MSLKKTFTSNNNLFIYLFIILIIDLLVLQLPLAGMLGYEYSAVSSILLTIISGIYSITYIRKEIFNPVENKIIFTRLFSAYLSFLFVVFIIGLAGTLSGLACSLFDGILFFIVITVPSVIVGGALGLLSLIAVKKFRIPFFFLLIILIAAVPALELYFNPQVYFYNPLIVYFPGTIYDEALSVNIPIVLYRLLNVIFFGLMLISFVVLRGNYKKYTLSFSFIIPIVFVLISPFLEFSTSEGRMERELNKKIETEHFNIFFDPQIDEPLKKAIALHHEFYYSELKEFFKAAPNEKITSFVFGSSKQKGWLLGSENADVAKPWLKQIYTTQESYNRSLKHELAHIFSGEYAWGIFKVAGGITPALIEGIAVAAHPVQDEYNVDYLAALAYNFGYKVKLEKLFSYTGFFTSVSTLSYVYAGSFVKYLIDNYGIEKIRKFFSYPDFNKIYNKSLSELEKDFTLYLITIDVSKREHTANYYFGRKSIFQKICPRYVADRIEKASDLYLNKQYDQSAEIFNGLYTVSESYVPLVGWINSLIKLNMFSKADSILISEIKKFEGTGYYYNLELKLADVSSMNEKYSVADSIYRLLELQLPNRVLYYTALTRRNLLSKDGLINTYLQGNDFDKYMILKELNTIQYCYNTFSAMVELSGLLDEDYNLFLKQFDHTLIVNDVNSAYAVYRLSEKALEKLDYEVARRMAALATRYEDDNGLNYIISENMDKMNWMRNNARRILEYAQVNK